MDSIVLHPTVDLLRSLVPESSISQKNGLRKAFRLWMILDTMYRNPFNISFPVTVSDWYSSIFKSREMKNYLNFVDQPFNVQAVPLRSWLLEIGKISEQKWLQDYQDYFKATKKDPREALQNFNQTLPYGQLRECSLILKNVKSQKHFVQLCHGLRRTVFVARIQGQYQIRILNRRGVVAADRSQPSFAVNQEFLDILTQAFKRYGNYTFDPQHFEGQQLIQFVTSAIEFDAAHLRLQGSDFFELARRGLIQKRAVDGDDKRHHQVQEFFPINNCREVCIRLKLPSEIIVSEQLADINQKFQQPIHGISRFKMGLNFITSEYGDDRIDILKTFLYQEVWSSNVIPPPIKFLYQSASEKKITSIITYPLLIYYYQRATYLFCYGQTPQLGPTEIQHYTFRMDRIESPEVLQWLSTTQNGEIPSLLIQLYQDQTLPNVETIIAELDRAWGLNIGRQALPMILRFERNYHDAYIQGSDRHVSFEPISVKTVPNFLSAYGVEALEIRQIQMRMKKNLQDAFYRVVFRKGDNNVLIKLRAWGSIVEVLHPADLRYRIQNDLNAAIAFYQN